MVLIQLVQWITLQFKLDLNIMLEHLLYIDRTNSDNLGLKIVNAPSSFG